MILAAIFAAVYAAYIVALRRRTRHHKAAAKGDTRFVVSVSQRVRDQL